MESGTQVPMEMRVTGPCKWVRSGCGRRCASMARRGRAIRKGCGTLVRGDGRASGRIRERRNGPPGDLASRTFRASGVEGRSGSSGARASEHCFRFPVPAGETKRAAEAGNRSASFGTRGERPASTTGPKLACPCRRGPRSRRNHAEDPSGSTAAVRRHGAWQQCRAPFAFGGLVCRRALPAAPKIAEREANGARFPCTSIFPGEGRGPVSARSAEGVGPYDIRQYWAPAFAGEKRIQSDFAGCSTAMVEQPKSYIASGPIRPEWRRACSRP